MDHILKIVFIGKNGTDTRYLALSGEVPSKAMTEINNEIKLCYNDSDGTLGYSIDEMIDIIKHTLWRYGIGLGDARGQTISILMNNK